MSKIALCLELETPRLRHEAFPWGPAEAELSANLYVANSSNRTTLGYLPSVCDLSALLPRAHSAAGGTDVNDKTSLTIEIMGCDHGITFPLGKATLEMPLKLKPGLEQNSSRSEPFRERVTDETGARAGTLSGAFVARRRAVGLSPPAVVGAPDAGAEGASSPVICANEAGKAGVSCAGEYDDGKEAIKCDDEKITDKAIEMLDMASKLMMTASSSSAGKRKTSNKDATEVTASATQGAKGAEAPSTHQGSKAYEARHGSEATPPGGTETPSVPPNICPPGEQPIRVATTGFRFEPTTGSVDWQRVAAVNVAKVEREGDLQTLRQFLPEVAVGRVQADDIDASPGLLNAFRMAQLQAQYVLHCEQVLQQQYNGQQAAVSSMKLEIEGNVQDTMAMKERARFLRKESRKQNKIITGYAAMLRRHNPGLASKVRLDEKGRLKVFNVDEATRKWGKRERHRTRQKPGGKREIDGLQVFRTSRAPTRKSSLQHTDDSSEESPSGLQGPASVDSWKEAESSNNVPAENIPGHSGAICGDSLGAREGTNTASNSDNNRRNQSAGGVTVNLNESEACDLGQGHFARAGNGDNIGSPGDGGSYSERTYGGVQDGEIMESHRKYADRSARVVGNPSQSAGRSVPDISSDVGTDEERLQSDRKPGSPRCDRETGEEEDAPREGGHRVFESGVDDGRTKGGRWNDDGPPPEVTGRVRESKIVGRLEYSREEAPAQAGELVVQTTAGDRKDIPRLVTVSVKPASNSSFSAKNNDHSGSPPPPVIASEAGVGSRDSQNLRRTNSKRVDVINVSERTRRDDATNDAPQTSEVDQWGRPAVKGGRDEDSGPSSHITSKVTVADASRLGLGEEDGVPDMSEFDVDDISDIEVGGEWGKAGGGGSLSS